MARPLQSQWASSYQLYYTIPQSPILILRPLYYQGTKMHKWHAMDPTAAPFMLFGGGWCRGQAGSIRFQLGFQVYPDFPSTVYYGKIPTTGICKGPGFRCLELLVCLGDMGVLGVEVCAAVVGGARGGSRRSYRGLDVKLQRPLVLIRKASTLPR